jgi:putative phage-type endonuclease
MPLSPEQKEARRSGIGGSDVAAILGISPWKTPYDVWLDKVDPTDGDDLDGKDHIIFGNLVEPVIRAEFARRNGKTVVEADQIYRSEAHPFMVANVDGIIVGENAGLEIKTASEYSGDDWGDENTDQVPQYYLTQGLHYLAVMGWDRIYFAVLIGGNKYRQYVVERDEEAVAALIAAETKFWNDYVLAKVAPRRNNEELKSAWDKTTGSSVDATTEIASDIERIKELKRHLEAIETEKSELESKVKEFISNNDELRYDGKKIASWKFNKPSIKFSASKLEKEAPDIYKRFCIEQAGPRVFRI